MFRERRRFLNYIKEVKDAGLYMILCSGPAP
jgi:hypothetical protein